MALAVGAGRGQQAVGDLGVGGVPNVVAARHGEQGEVVALAVLAGEAGGGAVHLDGVGGLGGLEPGDLSVKRLDLGGALLDLGLGDREVSLESGSGAGDTLANELGDLGLQRGDVYGHRGLLGVG